MDRMDAYWGAREKGLQWLLSQVNPDGSVGPVEEGISYYRVPWALAVCGRTREAAALLEWIRRNMFTAEGDFAGRFPRRKPYHVYPNANLVYGAHILRQFDISYRGIGFVIDRLQDPQNGGFFKDPVHTGPHGEEEVYTTSQAGLACLITGHLGAAEKVGAFLEMVWKAQPDPQNKLYHVFSPSQGLVTDLEGKDAVGAYVVEKQAERQWYFVPGIAAAVLARLYMATGKETYLNLAQHYQGFAMECTDKQFEVPQVGKTGWGAALLYQVTKESQYRDWTIRVGDYFVRSQKADGHWENIKPFDEPRYNLEATSEFVVHLDTIIGALST